MMVVMMMTAAPAAKAFAVPGRFRSSTISSRKTSSRVKLSSSSSSAAASYRHDDDEEEEGGEGRRRVVVALTRERGKNGRLREALLRDGELAGEIDPVELPCVAHAGGGPERRRLLPDALLSRRWDYVAVTSPEAARVLASSWPWGRRSPPSLPPPPAVAAVGRATEEALQRAGIGVSFCPSKATAEVLAKELPFITGTGEEGTCRVLYPASRRARHTLQKGLEEGRGGFAVTRLDTYDTVTADWTSAEREVASKVRIACFASPSAVKGWSRNNDGGGGGGDADHQDRAARGVLAACIGETSAAACRERGWSESDVFFPDGPGLDGWVRAVREAVERLRELRAVSSSQK
jgi:uroporphyrinogen-III synthase